MTLQASGQIDLSDINVELTNSATARIGLGDSSVRTLLGVPSGRISLGDAYGKFLFTLPPGGTGGAWVEVDDLTNWGSFMNSNAIWNQNTTMPSVETFEAPIYFPVTGTYTIQYAVNDSIGFAFDSGYITYNTSQTSGAGSSTSRTITQSFSSGYHTVYITVANTVGTTTWGVAMTIKDPSNNQIWSTRNTNFQNGNFDSGGLVDHGSYATFNTEWTIEKSGVNLNGVDTILGFPTPVDSTFPWPNMTGEKDIHNASLYSSIGPYAVSVSNDVPSGSPSGTQSLRLVFGETGAGTWFTAGNGYGTSRGPYLISNEFITVAANKNVKFWYKAAGLIDAFDVYAYIVDIYTGTKVTLLDESGQTQTSGTTWQEVTTTVPTAGIYKFVFVCGSWDYTGGLRTGAALFITRISVQQ